MHKFRTNRMVTDSERTSNRRLCPFYPVESFEHAQNRTRNGFTGLETDRTRTDGPLARCDRNFMHCMFFAIFFLLFDK